MKKLFESIRFVDVRQKGVGRKAFFIVFVTGLNNGV